MDLHPGRLFAGLDAPPDRALVAAVSGGSDSLALLFLLKSFLERDNGVSRLLAVTVDHGLRPEAADEARAVAALCASLGVRHRIVTWKGAKPAAGLSEAAREARYALLADAAAEDGADLVVTAHTMDDQAETVAMRARRGDGPGLAAMAPATLYDDRVWIVRPLLGVRRQALRDHLSALGIAWSDDPTNVSHAYERARVRAGLAASGGVEVFAATASAAARARRRSAIAAAELVRRFASVPSPGLFKLDPGLARSAGPETVYALRALLATTGGTTRLPDSGRTLALLQRLGGPPLRATLSRALVDVRASGIWIRREGRGVPTLALTDTPVLWDGRWRVASKGGASDLVVAPLGRERAADLLSAGADAPASLMRAALALEPALSHGDAFVGMASDPEAAARGVTAIPVAGPFARFLSGFDLPLAAALRRLVGSSPLPPSPWKDHIDAGA